MAQTAMKLVVDDANNHSQLLNGTHLLVHLHDAQSVHQAFSVVVDLLEREVVAIIITTQTSEATVIVSTDLGEAAKVPILSFSATSPLLSNRKFPYFVRMAHNDGVQMKAIAALVKAYGWKRIIFLHSDRYKDSSEEEYWGYLSLTCMLSLNTGEKRELDVHTRTEELAAMLYSSDTTGRSKGLISTHINIIAMTTILTRRIVVILLYMLMLAIVFIAFCKWLNSTSVLVSQQT